MTDKQLIVDNVNVVIQSVTGSFDREQMDHMQEQLRREFHSPELLVVDVRRMCDSRIDDTCRTGTGIVPRGERIYTCRTCDAEFCESCRRVFLNSEKRGGGGGIHCIHRDVDSLILDVGWLNQ